MASLLLLCLVAVLVGGQMLYAGVLVMGAGDADQLVLVLLMTMGFGALLTHLRPYRFEADQRLAEVAQWQMTLTVVFTIILMLSPDLAPARRLPLEVMVILVSCMVALAAVVLLAMEVRGRMRAGKQQESQGQGLKVRSAGSLGAGE